jgi:hypothetical protein
MLTGLTLGGAGLLGLIVPGPDTPHAFLVAPMSAGEPGAGQRCAGLVHSATTRSRIGARLCSSSR